MARLVLRLILSTLALVASVIFFVLIVAGVIPVTPMAVLIPLTLLAVRAVVIYA